MAPQTANGGVLDWRRFCGPWSFSWRPVHPFGASLVGLEPLSGSMHLPVTSGYAYFGSLRILATLGMLIPKSSESPSRFLVR